MKAHSPSIIRSLPIADKPRERLLESGAASLSDRELLAVLLGQGVPGKDVFSLAHEILGDLERRGGSLTMEALGCIAGLGPAQVARLLAAQEFYRRRFGARGDRICRAVEVLPHVRHYADRLQEYLLAIDLNGGREVLSVRIVTIGLLDRVQIHPREVFAPAIEQRAAGVILAHNHPRGVLEFSAADIKATKRLRYAGRILGVPLVDHVVFNRTSCLGIGDTSRFP